MVNIFDIELGNLYLYNVSIFRVDNISRLQEGLDPVLTMKDGSFFGGGYDRIRFRVRYPTTNKRPTKTTRI